MRAFIKRAVVLAGFVAAVSGVAFAAESNRQEVAIPFAFVVAGQTLPAGTYNVERPRDAESTIVMIQGEGKNRATVYALVISSAAARKSDGAMVFAKAGNQMRLSQVGGWSIAE
jgi:hypothetical protein